MSRIFLNYRRDDADVWADTIYRPLKARFDDVFMDVDGDIPVGFRWADWLDQQVQRCDALVALIGRRWVEEFEARAAPGARDYVRVEIESALARGVPVVPVFLGDAPEPDVARLPESVRPLLERQAFRVRRGRDLDGDLALLVEALDRAISLHKNVASPPRPSAPPVVEDPEERRWKTLSARLGAAADGGFQERLKSGGIGPAMVALRGGDFLMGSPDGVGFGDERPQHRVRVPSFAIGRYPVTRAEFERFAAASQRDMRGVSRWTGSKFEHGATADWREPGFTKGDDHPVVAVSWEDATAYCDWLSAETGAPYRLPSEAEWEFACRAGMTTAYAFGDEITPEQANFGRNVEGGRTTPVGAYPANAFGLHDLHGNVWEWCADAWNDSYDGAPDDGSAWAAGDRKRAALRGGSWNLGPQFLRSAIRNRNLRDGRLSGVGFRVTRTLAAP